MLARLVARAECTAQNHHTVYKARMFENLGAICYKVEILILLLRGKTRFSLSCMKCLFTLNSFKVDKNLESLKELFHHSFSMLDYKKKTPPFLTDQHYF